MRRLTVGVIVGTLLSLAVSRRRRAPTSVGQAAARARMARSTEQGSGSEPSGRPRSLEDLTKEELYHRAQEEDIPGRSQMSKGELIKALRQAHGR